MDIGVKPNTKFLVQNYKLSLVLVYHYGFNELEGLFRQANIFIDDGIKLEIQITKCE